MSPPSPKSVVRAQVRGALRGLPAQCWASDSQRLVVNLLCEPRLARARTIMAFAPMPDEPDIMPALRSWLDQGVRIALPRIDWAANVIVPAVLQVLAPPDLVESARGIREPGPSCHTIGAEEIDVVLVPGLAFSRDPIEATPGRPPGFARLGKGKGFYDRFLSRPGLRALTIGVAMNEQVVPSIPMDPWDVPVAGLATPESVVFAR